MFVMSPLNTQNKQNASPPSPMMLMILREYGITDC